ncbi:MAG: HAD-IA family hydrolase [Akkermansiaceae bacterium]|nr:HAD-IA family hydrolase [Akkermansiaceae bacterium]
MRPDFDLDGTLVDSLQGIAASLNDALRRSNFPMHSLETVRRFVGNGSRILIKRALPADSSEELIDVVEQSFKEHYEKTWPQGTVAYDGLADLLGKLQQQGYVLAVLSNKPHPFTAAMVSKIFPHIHFASVLGQRCGIPHKPDPTGALEISQSLGFIPADCIVVGDSTMDIETANHAGMKVIAVTWGFQDREQLLAAGASRIVDDPAELSNAICEARSA